MQLDRLRAAFSGRLITDPEQMAPYLIDWRRRWQGRALAVAQPDTAEDVARVVRWCASERVPIVPQGGNTGLSGASVPDGSGRALVLSLKRLDRVRSVDPINQTMTVEAGVVLAQAQAVAEEHGRLFPLSLAAEGSCTIGGNLSTNAGGVAVLRYGNARELCLGLEVVTAQGELWDGLRGLRKDNTGYDLRDLFIGAEGTLGIITAAVLKLFPLPKARLTAWAALERLADAVALLERARERLAERLTAFELLTAPCITLLLEQIPELRWPMRERSTHAVLIELSEPEDEAAGRAALEALLAEAMEAGWIGDAAVAQSLAQARAFWALRERMSEAQARAGRNIKHDIALPISRIPAFVETTNAALEARYPGVRMIVFGHLGDGNLHYNVSPPVASVDVLDAIEPEVNALVHDAVHASGGSISAEHGVGVLRRAEALRYKSPVELELMRRIKQALDPLGILNPGKGLGDALAR
ncbi:MAG: FAD-binding oxidoreductase [Burkholderiales bacterium]|nr:FAD-binding oxidoreductase [Burkholderiales bacterium]